MLFRSVSQSRYSINGFGRIGRLAFRALCQQGLLGKKFDVVAVNDLVPADNLAYLVKYDSVQGRYQGEVRSEKSSPSVPEDDILVVDGHKIKCLAVKEGPAQLSQAGALAPDQLYRLLQENLRAKDGQPVAVVGGIEVPVGEYITNLKNPGSGYEHHFAATNRAGMGVTGSARATALPGQSNPWSKDAWNVTEQMVMLSTDPDKARLLRAEAGI